MMWHIRVDVHSGSGIDPIAGAAGDHAVVVFPGLFRVADVDDLDRAVCKQRRCETLIDQERSVRGVLAVFTVLAVGCRGLGESFLALTRHFLHLFQAGWQILVTHELTLPCALLLAGDLLQCAVDLRLGNVSPVEVFGGGAADRVLVPMQS